jgi:hypothetical protein
VYYILLPFNMRLSKGIATAALQQFSKEIRTTKAARIKGCWYIDARCQCTLVALTIGAPLKHGRRVNFMVCCGTPNIRQIQKLLIFFTFMAKNLTFKGEEGRGSGGQVSMGSLECLLVLDPKVLFSSSSGTSSSLADRRRDCVSLSSTTF